MSQGERWYQSREAAQAVQGRVLTQAEVEEQILQVQDRMEEETSRYSDLCDAAAEAEAVWKYAHARALVVEAAGGGRTSADVRDARAMIKAGEDLYRAFRIAQERQRAGKEALLTLRARLDALRTVASNIRSAGG